MIKTLTSVGNTRLWSYPLNDKKYGLEKVIIEETEDGY